MLIRRHVASACLALSGALACGDPGYDSSDPEVPEAVVTGVQIDPSATHQTLEGFGAALAWYQGTLASHPLKQEIYELAFAELGLDILRFRNRYQRTDTRDRDLGPELEILGAATASLGHAPIVLLTSWSPPGAIKANGLEDCGAAANCTLRRDGAGFVYADFASYWYDSLVDYAAQGLAVDYVSIQNEPNFIPDWEGCKLTPSETADYAGYDRALAEVAGRLASLPDAPRLLGPEVLGIHWNALQEYVARMDVDLVYGLAHHLYELGSDEVWNWRYPGPASYLAPMRSAAAASRGKPLFQTEFQTDADNGTEGGFETAWLIHESLVDEGVAAFLYWDLVWSGAGLVSLDGPSYHLRDQYYSLRHYARFTDPGWVRVDAVTDATDLLASAYVSPDRRELTVVILNVGETDRTPAIDLGGFTAATSRVYRTVYRPGASETWVDLGSLADVGSVLVLPSRSVCTVVVTSEAP